MLRAAPEVSEEELPLGVLLPAEPIILVAVVSAPLPADFTPLAADVTEAPPAPTAEVAEATILEVAEAMFEAIADVAELTAEAA